MYTHTQTHTHTHTHTHTWIQHIHTHEWPQDQKPGFRAQSIAKPGRNFISVYIGMYVCTQRERETHTDTHTHTLTHKYTWIQHIHTHEWPQDQKPGFRV